MFIYNSLVIRTGFESTFRQVWDATSPQIDQLILNGCDICQVNNSHFPYHCQAVFKIAQALTLFSAMLNLGVRAALSRVPFNLRKRIMKVSKTIRLYRG